jgi:hypothetical protein
VSLYFNPTFASLGGGATKNTYINPVTSAGTTLSGGPALAGTWTVPAQSPTPAISSLSPAGAQVGGSALTLTVNGTNFVSGATVRWNGTPLTTTFLSATKLTVPVAANLIASAGSASVTVANPGTVISGAVAFPIQLPPSITSLGTTSAPFYCSTFTVTVYGSGFFSGATVKWNGIAVATSYISSTQLQATVTTAAARGSGVASVTVTNPIGLTSGSLPFTLLPYIGGLSPNQFTHGGAATVLTVMGTCGDSAGIAGDFPPAAVVKWNGTTLSTVNNTSDLFLTAAVPASLIATKGTASITVYLPGVGTSSAVSLPIN